jgi:hypothetical protein
MAERPKGDIVFEEHRACGFDYFFSVDYTLSKTVRVAKAMELHSGSGSLRYDFGFSLPSGRLTKFFSLLYSTEVMLKISGPSS